MPYLIKRTDSWGGYVTGVRGNSSYVVNPAHARKFDTSEAANAARCHGNEIVVPYNPRKKP